MSAEKTENQYLEAGRIVGTHGVRGEVKLRPSCDSAEFLLPLKTLYLNGQPVMPISKRVHKEMLLITLPGYDTVEKAMALINSTLYFDRADIKLPKGVYYFCDLIGLQVFDTRLNRVIGKLTDIMERPASSIYVVTNGKEEYLIPVAGNFIESVDLKSGVITVNTIPGMVGDE